MPIPSCLVDTNILLRITKRADPFHQVIGTALTKLASDRCRLYFAHQNIAELWNVMARPRQLADSKLRLEAVRSRRKCFNIMPPCASSPFE